MGRHLIRVGCEDKSTAKSVNSVLQPLSLGFPAGEPMPVDFVRAVAKSVVEVGDLDDPLTRERHDRFCGKCNNHSSSTHALHRLQRQANEVRPYGRWDKSLRSFHAADGGAVRRVTAPYKCVAIKLCRFCYFNFFSRRTPLYGPSVQVPAGTKPRFS